MAEDTTHTLAPKSAPDALTPSPAQPQPASTISAKNAVFDSIANDTTVSTDEGASSPLTTFFAGLLWFGYAVAIVVALVLVWSAANGLLKSLPR